MNYFNFLFILFFITFIDAVAVDYAYTKVWGPAFKSDAQIHVRYFYIQAYDHKNKMYCKFF